MNPIITQLDPIEQAVWRPIIAGAAFAPDLLEVDEALWGGFWQGDVLSPGHLLPLAELNLLRLMRLDKTWPETTSLESFLREVEAIKQNASATMWVTEAAGMPCLVWGVPDPSFIPPDSGGKEGGKIPESRRKEQGNIVLWYSLTTHAIHAVYWTHHLAQLGLVSMARPENSSLAARLDAAILRHWQLRLFRSKT